MKEKKNSRYYYYYWAVYMYVILAWLGFLFYFIYSLFSIDCDAAMIRYDKKKLSSVCGHGGL